MKINFVGEGGKCHGDLDDAIPPEVSTFIDTHAEAIARGVESRAKGTAGFVDKTGKLRRAIKAYKSKYPDGGYIVGAWAPHAWLVEYGHEVIDWHSGKKVGQAAPHPFLRPALEWEISRAIHEFGAE